MKKFTAYQKEELLALLEIRLETILDDPESADSFETEESLNTLKYKLEFDIISFTEKEINWMLEEIENRQEVGYANQANEGVKVLGFINSMENIIKKLKSL